MPEAGSQPIPLSARRSARSSTEAGPLRSRATPRAPAATGPGSRAGRRSVSRYRSAWIGSAGWWPRPRMRSGTHGFPVGMVRWIGVPSPRRWPRALARLASKLAAMKIGLRAA